MNKEACRQYMETLREAYPKGSKKEKGKILDEYCRNTGMERKDAIKRFRYKARVKGKREKRKARKETYGGAVKTALTTMWKVFDFPCGARLASILKAETGRMRDLGELACSDETAGKLAAIVPSTIDEKPKHGKDVGREKRKSLLCRDLRYAKKRNPLLCSKVPTKTSAELDRENPGVVRIDFVENRGMSAAGEYVNSLSTTDIFSGWWEGAGVIGKGQERALSAIDEARMRSPFAWRETHPDNGSDVMNYSAYRYAEDNKIAFSRSRPCKKNDNCFVERKNPTHVRQVVGYLRYDTEEEREIIDAPYRNEPRLCENFFQPVMKLAAKTRVCGKIKKKYDTPKTPYRRLMESGKIAGKQKGELRRVYESLNPAALKRTVDARLAKPHRVYQKKHGSQQVNAGRGNKSVPSLASFFIGQPAQV